MYDCSTIRKLVHASVDRELDVKESLRVQTHVTECESCRDILLDEQTFLTLMTTVLEPPRAPERMRLAVREALSNEVARIRGTKRRRLGLVSPGMAAAVCGLAVFLVVPHTPVSEPVKIALSEHRRYMKDPARLQITTSDVRAARQWLARRLPFPLDVPIENATDVRLVGAAVRTGADAAAVLAYDWQGAPLSLLVTAAREIPVAGADALTFKNILFYASRLEGRYVLQWSDRRHNYVLVACRELPLDSLPFDVGRTGSI